MIASAFHRVKYNIELTRQSQQKFDIARRAKSTPPRPANVPGWLAR
jgi:hypothetical protein